MAWLYLVAAGILEIVWAFAMKRSTGFTHRGATVITFVAMLGSVWLLSIAMKTLPLGTAYAIWTGIGAAGAFVVGVLVLGESPTPGRVAGAVLILGGLALLKWATPESV